MGIGISGDWVTAKGNVCIRRELKNRILSKIGDYKFSDKGGIGGLIFENSTMAKMIVERELREIILADNRITLNTLDCIAVNNDFIINIEYSLVGGLVDTLNFTYNRVR
jgi:hypothetical protein